MTVAEHEIGLGIINANEHTIISRATLATKDTTRSHQMSTTETDIHMRLTMHGGWLAARRRSYYTG